MAEIAHRYLETHVILVFAYKTRHVSAPNCRCGDDAANSLWQQEMPVMGCSVRRRVRTANPGDSHRASQKGPERCGSSPAALSLNVGHCRPSICWLLVLTLAESRWLGGESAPQNMLDWIEMETIMLFGCSGGVGNGLQNSLHEPKISWRWEIETVLWKRQIYFKALI